MKNAIFTYCNFQIDPRIAENQRKVVEHFTKGHPFDFMPLFYNEPDGVVFPDYVINYALKKLFYELSYDNILVLDIDCVPLSTDALYYIFEKASQGSLIGNAQRSLHIENNEHVFIGSSCFCINKNVFEQLGKPDMGPTVRGDIAEEFVYIAEEKNMPVEFLTPKFYESSPQGIESWPLRAGMNNYGIGTTFMNSDGKEMFYHLFESRLNLNVERFIKKCNLITNNGN